MAAPTAPALVHNGAVKHLARAAALLFAVIGAGCATAHARTAPAGPPLETPVPPPHTIQVPDESVPPATPAEGAASRPLRTPPRITPAKPDKPDPVQPPAAQPPAQEGPPLPPLQTTTNVPEVEKKVRALLSQAVRDLDRTDYRALSAERRTEYDTARRFIRQAEDALKVKNVVYAEQLADKAATLAARLIQREPLAVATAGSTPV